jgi:glycosyltransferase involved in cell wall biosynthesis
MLGIFDSHPVQYRAPVYRELERLVPGSFHVFYSTDISIRGHQDQGFGKKIAWDESLLVGYASTILSSERGEPLKGFRSLSGRGVAQIFRGRFLSAVLQTQYLYSYDFEVLWQARSHGIPVWIRQETQDEAFSRNPLKSVLRSIFFRALYSQIDFAFPIGVLNMEHMIRHGMRTQQMSEAHYCTPDRFGKLSEVELMEMRSSCRSEIGISDDSIVIGFFGKLIPKKNPDLLLQAVLRLPIAQRSRIVLLIIGSGFMEGELRRQAEDLELNGVSIRFAGFVNQSEIAPYYAATDVMVLPSRRAGETWGLVVNEALQAGCSVVMSDAVGCHREFGEWPYCRVFKEGNPQSLAGMIAEMIGRPFPSRRWARPMIEDYSVSAAASSIARVITQRLRLPTMADTTNYHG